MKYPICQNCEKIKADVENYSMDLCNSCERKISKQLDKIADLMRSNRQIYGNEDGGIDSNEYWGRNVGIS